MELAFYKVMVLSGPERLGELHMVLGSHSIIE
jgi:hypothetical protein